MHPFYTSVLMICVVLYLIYVYFESLQIQLRYCKCVHLILEEFKKSSSRYADKRDFTRKFLTGYSSNDIDSAFELLVNVGCLQEINPIVQIPDPDRFAQEKLKFYQVTTLGRLESVPLKRKQFFKWQKNLQTKLRAKYSKKIDLTKIA